MIFLSYIVPTDSFTFWQYLFWQPQPSSVTMVFSWYSWGYFVFFHLVVYFFRLKSNFYLYFVSYVSFKFSKISKSIRNQFHKGDKYGLVGSQIGLEHFENVIYLWLKETRKHLNQFAMESFQLANLSLNYLLVLKSAQNSGSKIIV